MKLDIKPEHGDKMIRDLYSVSQLKSLFPAWYDRWTRYLLRTETDFSMLSVLVVKWQEMGYSTSPLGPMNPLASTTDIECPEGLYLANYIMDYGYADYSFGGTFVYYPGNGSTNIGVWHEQWKGGADRDLFRHAMHGTDLSGSYSESFSFQNVRLLGRAAKSVLADPSYRSCGANFWDCGETSKVDRIYAEGFNNQGMRFIRGTPAQGENLTAFNNCDAGIQLVGTAGNSFDFGVISGDDNGILFEQVAGFGREAGGQTDIDLMKSEAGVTPIERNPHRKQKLMVLRGQSGTNVGVCRGSHNQVRVDNLIEVDCRLTNGAKQVSNLVIGSINGFNYGNVVKDLANGWEAADPGDFNCFSLQYSSFGNGGLFNPFHTFAKVPSGSTNPPAATWVLGAPVLGPCVNNVQTVTTPYVSSIAGQTPTTPKPADVVTSQACGTPPVGQPKDKRTYTNKTTTTTRVVVPSGVNPISRTKLVNLKLDNANIAFINSHLLVGQGGTLWRLSPNGWLNTGIAATPGTAMNAEIEMPNTTLTHVIGGGGATAIFTGVVEVY